ncbi:Na+/H+ antiporter subunit A [Tsukamurella soli]|uniref:Na+/H+ antiporter subunit A n=1 Tax=Tsukamurella soli TaxID=644556 RepID=A0ABP8JWB4_9ACTN
MLVVLITLSLATLAAPVLTSFLGARAFLVLAAVPAGCLVWVLSVWPSASAPSRTEHVPWVPALHMALDLRLTPLAAIMSVLVLGVGAAILVYCAGYFRGARARKLPVFAAELVAFMAAMFGLVTSDNMLLMYTFWELTSVLSFLLVGYYAERASSRRAAMQALLVTTLGGLAMLVGIITLAHTYHTFLLSELIARAGVAPVTVGVEIAVVLVLLGALSKSAIVPLHFWLPGAMAAPTPVSGYLHAAAMVKAGIYLVAVLAPAFGHLAAWRILVLGLGLFSMILAGWRSLREYDLKLILAFGTVSQLGFLMVLMGTGERDTALAGTAMLLAHALFKATLFMVVGIIDHSTGTRDIRRLAGLRRARPVLAMIAAVAAASMAGLPPMLGFVGKEAALETVSRSGVAPGWVPTVLVVGMAIGSALTVAYSIRFLWGAFGGKGQARPTRAVAGMHAPGPLFLAAPAALATLTLLGGLAAGPLDKVLRGYADAAYPEHAGHGYHLALWHGWTMPLLLTAVIVAVGVGIAQPGSHLARLRRRDSPLLGNADRWYDAALRAADVISLRMTRETQRGSLPTTQATILVTLVALPSAVLALGTRAHGSVTLHVSPVFAPIALLMCAAAVTATVLRNRLATVLVVSVTGYGTGVVFSIYGAPDLALTQFLVETVTLVVFVLVLRKLPPEAPILGSRPSRAARAALGVAVAAMVVTVGVCARIARTAAPLADRLPGQAYEFGYGHNTVNVILVDVRAWDTFGEISVLLVVATGVASLVFRNRRFGAAPRVADVAERVEVPTDPGTTWLRGSALRDPRHRSLVLEVTSRLVFPTIMVLSLYFFFAGHNAPGGGFAGGLTAGLALVLRYLAGGRYEIGETIPLDAGKILGTGLLLSASGAVVSLLLGAPALSSTTLALDLPLFGHIKIVTVLIFDAGVYLIVVGLVLDVLRSLGARLDLEGAPADATSAIPVQRVTGPLNPGGRA